MDTVKAAYRYLPVTARYGNGAYTYTFIMEKINDVYRYEIFANNFEDALYRIQMFFNFPVSSYIATDSSTWQIFFGEVQQSRCHVIDPNIDARYYLYLD